MTQPAISDQVRKLERDNDVLLFSRIRKKVVLTHDGEELFAKTRAYFELEGEIKGLLSETANRIEEELRIMVDSASHISSVIQRFRKTHPGVRIVIASGNTEEIVRRLRFFEADIGVIGSGESHDDFEALSLSKSKLVAFARRDFSRPERGASHWLSSPISRSSCVNLAPRPGNNLKSLPRSEV